jgi:hypothetical protein
LISNSLGRSSFEGIRGFREELRWVPVGQKQITAPDTTKYHEREQVKKLSSKRPSRLLIITDRRGSNGVWASISEPTSGSCMVVLAGINSLSLATAVL